MTIADKIKLIADRFVQWQTPYGRPDPKRCPFVFTDHLVTSVNFHSPTFMAIGLYRAYEGMGNLDYKVAADRYITYYLACLRDPRENGLDTYGHRWVQFMGERYGHDAHRERWAVNILAWPFIYGMALAGYREFRKHNPQELAFESKAAAVYDWLLRYRWDEGSYFRNGYGSPQDGVVDAANSDDNCHMGRGLMAYYDVSGNPDALRHAEGLAKYFLTDVKPGTYQGCWSPRLGCWVVAPTIVDQYEHLSGRKSYETAWGFSVVGAIEFLTELARRTDDAELRQNIGEKCTSAMRWQFDVCQFDDGAVGMAGPDDKWLGMTAGAVLSYRCVRDAGLLSDALERQYQDKANRAFEWLVQNVTEESIENGGYIKVSGNSEPRPPENLAWLLGWTLEALQSIEEHVYV